MTTLGIGDESYAQLSLECRDSLVEYYKVSSLENYDEVDRAVAFFAFKYGRIDWQESNNEYWMLRDAQMRTDFNINTGLKNDNIDGIKYKSKMKEYYAKAGVPTARYHLVTTLEEGLAFVKEAGYMHNRDEIFGRYHQNIVVYEEMPEVLASAMGDYAYMVRFETEEEMFAFADFVSEKKEGLE